MATTGELLVIYSTLTTGTALEHFTNISTGGGRTVYYSDALTGVISDEILDGSVQVIELTGVVTVDGLESRVASDALDAEIEVDELNA